MQARATGLSREAGIQYVSKMIRRGLLDPRLRGEDGGGEILHGPINQIIRIKFPSHLSFPTRLGIPPTVFQLPAGVNVLFIAIRGRPPRKGLVPKLLLGNAY